jgi:hypothetical protein
MDNESTDGENGENGENGNGANLAAFSKAISMLIDAQEKLNSQNIKTPAAVKVKMEVIGDIANTVEIIRMLRNTFCHDAIAGLNTIKEQMKELNASMKEIKEATKAKTIGSPWITIPPTSKPFPDPKALKIREQKTATRQERAKFEVTLTATTEETKKSLAAMSYKDITERIQTTINTNVHHDEKPSVFGVSKPTKEGTVRVRCETEEQAKMLRHINWESGLEGLQARQPKFGIVIHAVNKAHFNIFIDADKPTTLDRIEKENTLPIVKIAPLRRKDNKKITEYHSIVIFTTDPHAADRCIKRGLYLDYCLYPAERYTPQLQITQCYNCGKYGHRAAYCKHKHCCGKCGDEHGTKDCKDDSEPKCSNCGGKHENWHHECPTRIAEAHRLDNLRWQLSPYFTS